MARCRFLVEVAIGSAWLFHCVCASDLGEWVWGAQASKKHVVDDLTGDNFGDFLKDNPVAAVMFYAPWCFYSQQLMPAWDLAAQKLQIHDPPVKLVKIDTHRYGSVGNKYGVVAYPTMKLFIDGAVFEYESQEGRGWQQIVKWVNKHIDRDHVLTSVDQVDHYLHDNELNVVGLYVDGRNSSIFANSARHYDDVVFAEARGTSISQEIAVHLAKHASLVCETIDIGQSDRNSKDASLPRDMMHCDGIPRNPQRPDWTDKYTAEVKGQVVTVKRDDSGDGWQQLLQIKCCDAEDSTKEQLTIPVPSVVMFMPHDERFAIYDGDIEDIHKLDHWINARRTPMVMHLSPSTAEKILESNGPEHTPVMFFISKEQNNVLEQELRGAAKQLRGRVLLCFSGMLTQIEKRLAEMAGVEEGTGPVLTLIEAHGGGGGNYHNSKKYRVPMEGLSADSVVQWVTDYEQGTLKPWLRSEPAPTAEELRNNLVGVLVGSTFTDAAQDTTKDVLVDFYAPWCGHCRKFEPLYKQIAKKLKHVKTLRIDKVDATRNEIEGMQIMAFPTIVLFPAGQSPKDQIQYQGNRQPDDIVRWLHQHVTIKFDDTPPPELEQKPEEDGLLDPSEEDL